MSVSAKDQGTIDGAAQRVARPVGNAKVVQFVVDTSAYASGDLVADMVEITGAADVAGGSVVIDQITLFDKADQTASAYTLVFGSASTSLGTINSAPNISDANALASALRVVGVALADWVDMGGVKVATLRDVKLPLHCAAGQTSIWVGIVNGAGTPTFTASDVVAHIDLA
jgi:hypothetical protein